MDDDFELYSFHSMRWIQMSWENWSKSWNALSTGEWEVSLVHKPNGKKVGDALWAIRNPIVFEGLISVQDWAQHERENIEMAEFQHFTEYGHLKTSNSRWQKPMHYLSDWTMVFLNFKDN